MAKPAGKRASLTGLRQKLDGGSCLNQRSIAGACSLFRGEGAGSPLALAELFEALWVLELMVVSNGISYDGTLPVRDQERLRNQIDALMSVLRSQPPSFSAITPKNDAERVEFARSAAMKALEDVGGLTPREEADASSLGLIPELDRPLDDSAATRFFQTLEMGIGRRDVDVARAERDDELLAMLGGSFRGSKCVAGILALGAEGAKRALATPDVLNCAPALAAGALINRFRFTYVRQLSFGARDVYVPAASWRKLSAHHAITFAEVVRRNFQRKYAGDLTSEIEARLQSELGGADRSFTIALPPLGLYCLMKVDPRRGPSGVVESALEMYADYGKLFRKFWSTTREIEPPPGGWTVLTGNRGLDTVSEPIEQFLTDRLGRLEKAAFGPGDNGSKVDRYLTPIVKITAAVGGAVLGTAMAGQPAVGPLLGTAAGTAAGWVAEQLYGASRGAWNGHVDQYRALDANLLRAYSGMIRLDRLSAQVSAVFGRPLNVGV